MEVTQDEYELPVTVAYTVAELARLRGAKESTIYSCISHEKAGRIKSKYKKVEVEDD